MLVKPDEFALADEIAVLQIAPAEFVAVDEFVMLVAKYGVVPDFFMPNLVMPDFSVTGLFMANFFMTDFFMARGGAAMFRGRAAMFGSMFHPGGGMRGGDVSRKMGATGRSRACPTRRASGASRDVGCGGGRRAGRSRGLRWRACRRYGARLARRRRRCGSGLRWGRLGRLFFLWFGSVR